MALHRSFISCGIGELFQLSSYTNSPTTKLADPGWYWDLEDVAEWMYSPHIKLETDPYTPRGAHRDMQIGGAKAFLVFSTTTYDSSIAYIIKAIRDLDLGTVIQHGPVTNPRTASNISLYVWQINHKNYKAWYNKILQEKLPKTGT